MMYTQRYLNPGYWNQENPPRGINKRNPHQGNLKGEWLMPSRAVGLWVAERREFGNSEGCFKGLWEGVRIIMVYFRKGPKGRERIKERERRA